MSLLRVFVRVFILLALLATILLLTHPVEVKKQEIPVSYGKECINGRLYWVYRNPRLGEPFEVPVGDSEGKYVGCSTS